jgi:hypothetical protein
MIGSLHRCHESKGNSKDTSFGMEEDHFHLGLLSETLDDVNVITDWCDELLILTELKL